MMETIFILAASILPCLVYLSMGFYLIFRYRRGREGADAATLRIQKDYIIFLFVIALCFFSGCLILWFGKGMEPSVMTERTVLKVYTVSSSLPCILLRRCVYSDRPGVQFYVPVLLVSALILLTEVMLYAGGQGPSFRVMCRSAVIVNLIVFLYVSHYTIVMAFTEVSREKRIVVKELLVHLAFMALYNFLFLLYSFGLHFTVDYFLTVTGFAVVHASVASAVSRSRTLVSFLRLNRDALTARDPAAGQELSAAGFPQGDDGCVPKDGCGCVLSLRERLLDYFESEKPYLSKSLTMEEVAMRLYTNKSYLSKTINMEMNKNFRELVNYYRVKEAISIFSSDTDMSMTDLRDRCGFNNNASFTSAFKLNTGYTPGEWCRDMKDRREKAMNK